MQMDPTEKAIVNANLKNSVIKQFYSASSSCPMGAQMELSSERCLWLSTQAASWSQALDSCRRQGGDVANANTIQLQSFIHHSFLVKGSEWIWVQSTQSGLTPSWQDRGQTEGMCPQITLGILGRNRKSVCAGQYRFLCEKLLTDVLPSPDSFLTGLVLMSGVYAQTQVQVLSRPADVAQNTVEMQLFPGLWFSHAGQLFSVELVVQPSAEVTQARVQILRPYCSPDLHLVPPGCISLLNPFSACSAVPLCNTTGGCGLALHWCPLLETCIPSTRPCSPYDPAAQRRGFTLPPRHPSSAGAPLYHLAADLPLTVSASPQPTTLSLLLPSKPIMVYPDDIVAIQHTRSSGSFLHCTSPLSSPDSPWRQSYLSLSGPDWGGWLEGGLTSLSHGAQWVDEVICDLKITYMNTLHHGTEFGDFFSYTETTTLSDMATSVPGFHPTFGLTVIHPAPDANNKIHVQINVPILVVVKIKFGDDARSLWSGPVLQSDVAFVQVCPKEVAQMLPYCVGSKDAWFSSATLMVHSVGEQTMGITVVRSKTSESLEVKVLGYEAVAGLSVEPRGCTRIIVNTGQMYAAKVESGTSVNFTWLLDDLRDSAHEGATYNVILKKVAQYQLKVTASNPVSSQIRSFLLTAEEVIPFSSLEFMSLSEIMAVNSTQLFTLKVNVDISLPLKFRWDFNDSRGSSIIHSHSALCEKIEGLVDSGVKATDILDSVNYTFSEPNIFTVTVEVVNQYSKLELSKKISVRDKLQKIIVTASPVVPVVNQILLLEASTEPKSNNILYTWDFGDSSSAVLDNKITHTFGSPGHYNVTISANNWVSVVNSWILVEIMEKITGLVINYNGPAEMNTPMDFKADVQTGTSLSWKFDFGDGSYQDNLRHGSVSHIYKAPGNYTVGVTVSNFVSEIYHSVIVEVFKLEIHGILPTGCVMAGQTIHLEALVGGGNISTLTFHWSFGDGKPVSVVTGNSSTTYLLKKHGLFNLNLTVISRVSSTSFRADLCVENVIANVDLKQSKSVVAVGVEACFEAIVNPDIPNGLQYEWTDSAITSMSESNEKCFVFNKESTEEVAVLVSNSVSKKMGKAFITVQKPVGKFLVEYGPKSVIIVNSETEFWVANCSGSNVTVQWDFGDSLPMETGKNVSHVFASTGQFIVIAKASNLVSQELVRIQVSVLPPVSDLSIHTKQMYVATGEETIFTAVSGSISSTNYYWTVLGAMSSTQGTYEFKFTFAKPGSYQVKVVAQNLVSTREATITIDVFERIAGLEIGCASLTDLKYIPTNEEVQFYAFISKGSSVTYNWLVTQHGESIKTTVEAEILRLAVQNPGEVVIKLRAENNLGGATSNITVVAIERVKVYETDEQKYIVPLGQQINISVVLTGSDLRYSWYICSDQSPIQTQVPFLFHSFTKLGTVSIVVSVQNVLSQCNVSKVFDVQEEIQDVSYTVGGKVAPFYVKTNSSVVFSGHVKKGSNLYWHWNIQEGSPYYFNTFDQFFTHTFQKYGIYSVSLNVSNGLSYKMIADSLTVQDGIVGLALNVSKFSLCVNDGATFTPTILHGTNVSYVITLRNNDVNKSYDFVEEYTTSSLAIGTHLVIMKAWNQVGIAEVSTTVAVHERIQGLRFVNCCLVILEALKELVFTATVENTYSVNYTWIFEMNGYEQTKLLGQDVVFTPPNAGVLRITVVASNDACSEKLTENATVEMPVKMIDLSSDFEDVFLNYVTTFTAKANGSNLNYQWDFGDTCKIVLTNASKVSHTYYKAGKYVVTVTVFNSVGKVSQQLLVDVRKIECSNPQISIVPSHSVISMSRPSYFEAIVRNSCSAYKTTYLWEIFACTNLIITGKRANFQTKVDATSPFLQLPKHSLDVGQYCLVFTAFYKGTPVYVQHNTSVTVVHSPLVAVIKGGSDRTWPSNRDLVLDGGQSRDPDVEPGMENELEYDWTVHTQNSTNQHLEQAFGRNTNKMTVPSTHLHPGCIYLITLTVHKPGRKPASASQTVMVTETSVLLTVECTSCLAQPSPHVSSTRPLKLLGLCPVCSDQAQYKWTFTDVSGRNIDLNEISTESSSAKLVVRSGALDPADTYIFTLSISEPQRGQWGRSSLTLLPTPTPQGGHCELSPEQGILLLDTVVTYNCSEWQHGDNDGESAQLIYSFQVVLCSSCPVITLYRGMRSTFGSVVPIGNQSQENETSLLTVLLLIENSLGAKITALNRTLEVRNPIDNSSKWLRSKAQTELRSLVQHGNPQEIIPYSMALLSHLNQVEPRNFQEIQERREMRQNVTQVLSSLSVSSLNDAAQISSALMQSTAVPSELDSALCQERVLEAVERMIQAMEAEHEDDFTAVQTGSNIVNIIGNTLAAVSKSTSESSSALSLSALAKTRFVVRTLTQSHDQPDTPLSISTPYIRALGFHGDPLNLLCTGQSNLYNSCQFEIPESLLQDLKEQNNSQLVQVMFGIGNALESNPLLTAADPPITTDVVAMEISTPDGQPVSVQDLEAERAIRVTLPRKNHIRNKNETCLVMSLSQEENQMNFTVKDLKALDANAGVYMAFNFSLVSGARAVSQLHVLVALSSTEAEENAPASSMVTDWALSLPTPVSFTERTIFLSPLALCFFYNHTQGRWSSDGLRPLEGATLHQAHCLTQHLTMFGASMFVHPGAVVLLPPSGGPVLTLLAGVVCAVLALLHLLLGLVCHRLDHWDRVRLSQVPLCGRPGLYHYRVLIKTGRRPGAGTTAHVGISLFGVTRSGSVHLQREGAFQRGGLDHFHLESPVSLGEVWKIRIWHDNTGLDPSWFVQRVVVWDPQTDSMFFFLVDDWLSVENPKHGSVEKEVLASCPDELCAFGRVLSSQLLLGLVDRHLWWSVWERPAHSLFTRGQRVSCCALSLHLYLALGALWYGALGSTEHSGPVSARVLLNMETVAMGTVLALLVFPLQCLLCFLFGKTYSPVSMELSVPPSPLCHSVEMDVCLDQSRLSGPSFMSLPDSSAPIRDSPSSFLELDSSLLDLCASSGLAPHSPSDDEEELWPSCTSLLSAPAQCEEEVPTLGPARLLRRKKALVQRHQCTSRVPRCPPTTGTAPTNGPIQTGLTTLLTLSEPLNTHLCTMCVVLCLIDENLMMSIVAAEDVPHPKKKNSDSGRDSPTTISPLSTFHSTCSSSWSEDSEVRYLWEEDNPGSSAPLWDGALYRSASVPSIDSVASTVLPSPPPDCTRCPSSTRIGVARGSPGWLLPSWTLHVVYPVVAMLIITCMVLVGVYGSFFSRPVLLMWLGSVLSAFLTSALLLEPAKVCAQAVLCSVLWRPVDTEAEELLSHESSVVRSFTEHSEHIRPPCGYGLLQAKQEAYKVRALTSLMRHCVWQLLFLMLLLMVNYQDHVEQQKGRLLHSATKQHLHRAPMGVPNLTGIRHWADAEQWVRLVLVPHLHERPSLRLAGLPWLQYTHSLGPAQGLLLGNSSKRTLQYISELHMDQWSHTDSLSVRWTHYHTESGLWLCVRVRLHLTQLQRVTRALSILPLLLPSSSSPPDLQMALSVLLVMCGLLMLGAELYSVRTEHMRLQQQPNSFIRFHRAALLSQRASQCAAVLLTLLVLRLLGTLRFVRRWVVMGRVLHRAWKELMAIVLLLILMLLLCGHIANTVFADTVEGFVSLQQTSVSVLSLLRGHRAVHSLCRLHPHLGSLYCLLLTGGTLWLLARICGAVLIRAYRSEKVEMFRPTIEPQDYEMVEFFIKRLKLWMGLTKTKEFRHRVKFEGMNVPPSRSSQNSRPSTISSVPSFRSPSPRPLSSSLSVKSEDSTLSASKSDTAPSLDRLLPSVTAMLAQFDRVNQITEEVYQLEMRLEDAQIKRQAAQIQKRVEKLSDAKPETSDVVRQRRSGFLYPNSQPTSTRNSTSVPPRTRNSFSESESFPPKPHLRRNTFGATKPSSVSSSRCMSPAAGFVPPIPRRRAWHSGSSHSADAAQRILQWNERDIWGVERPRSEDGARRGVLDGIPMKRKAWILEGGEGEQG
ncbi:LOW QUALITY PROTEIN: polycystin-1 [Boleophthalmus pectinirostris]|uniref:LOW QUALITY PROTEIN: polycystin-1 n=1 Tax=Boleophthalmus pectinirostris TaxID=150288 RepID=UPI00242B4660|nr:LOW QUALITY PROTEIN: polycystin-1 [Boleophthalmus pectinirostris]